jgi:hypothetical protein
MWMHRRVATLLLVLTIACSICTASSQLAADSSAAETPSGGDHKEPAARAACQHAACADVDAQFRPHEYDQADPWHWQLMQHVGLMLAQHNTSSNSSSTAQADSTGSTAELVQCSGRTLLDVEASNSSTADPADTQSPAAATQLSANLDIPAPLGAASTPTSSSAPSAGGPSTAIVALERKEAMLNAMFRAALQLMGMANPSKAWVRYYRVKITRIMLLLTDIAWLMYAAGNCAQRAFALLVPIVKIGQTGQLTLNGVIVMNWLVLIFDFIARFADLIAKIFLVVFRGINLAATWPPVT